MSTATPPHARRHAASLRLTGDVMPRARLVVCIHDVSPAFAHETRAMLRDLAPIVGRRLALAVVPDWHGAWPLTAHPGYCRMVRDGSEELLLHGYFHRRGRGWGPATVLAGRCDEMNGLDAAETQRTLERGQQVFTTVFGTGARGFVAPAWQSGHVHRDTLHRLGLEHVVGFFSLRSGSGRTVPLATWTWDCGRWGWLGHVGHTVGWIAHARPHAVPVLAMHPRDLPRGFWPKTLRLLQTLIDRGYEPSTVAGLLEARAC